MQDLTEGRNVAPSCRDISIVLHGLATDHDPVRSRFATGLHTRKPSLQVPFTLPFFWGFQEPSVFGGLYLKKPGSLQVKS